MTLPANTTAAWALLFNAHEATIATLTQAVADNTAQLADLSTALDSMWLLSSAYLVFIMQLGFALLEAGSVRAMNTKNILMQNTLDTCISVLMYWLVGYGISRAGPPELGSHNPGIGDFGFSATLLPRSEFAKFIFLWAFCNAATTIVSGSVTSRVKFNTYISSCVLISGWTFPVVAYWVWSYGWLGTADPNGLGLIDYAGGTVVHMVGGFSALVGCIVVGPRTGRFVVNDAGVVEDHRESGHSIVLATIGTFLLWFGWFGFNSGSTFGLSNGLYLVAANCAVNSLISAAAAGGTIAVWSVYFAKTHDMWELLNGMLCGLVAITPACATVNCWGAVLIGALSIPVYRAGVRFVSWCRIDDVVDAFAVHGCCGTYGTLMTGLLSTQFNCDAAYGVGRIKYSPGHQFGVQLLAVVCVAAFTSACSLTLFLIIKYTVGVRVSEADERVGLDFKYHSGYAYPDFNARVKKAHEQITMEAEIAAQIRRALAQGKGARFKDAVSMPASMFDSAAGMQAQAEKEAEAGKQTSSGNAPPQASASGTQSNGPAKVAPSGSPSNRNVLKNRGTGSNYNGSNLALPNGPSVVVHVAPSVGQGDSTGRDAAVQDVDAPPPPTEGGWAGRTHIDANSNK